LTCRSYAGHGHTRQIPPHLARRRALTQISCLPAAIPCVLRAACLHTCPLYAISEPAQGARPGRPRRYARRPLMRSCSLHPRENGTLLVGTRTRGLNAMLRCVQGVPTTPPQRSGCMRPSSGGGRSSTARCAAKTVLYTIQHQCTQTISWSAVIPEVGWCPGVIAIRSTAQRAKVGRCAAPFRLESVPRSSTCHSSRHTQLTSMQQLRWVLVAFLILIQDQTRPSEPTIHVCGQIRIRARCARNPHSAASLSARCGTRSRSNW
jgi:hypothetical protein